MRHAVDGKRSNYIYRIRNFVKKFCLLLLISINSTLPKLALSQSDKSCRNAVVYDTDKHPWCAKRWERSSSYLGYYVSWPNLSPTKRKDRFGSRIKFGLFLPPLGQSVSCLPMASTPAFEIEWCLSKRHPQGEKTICTMFLNGARLQKKFVL